jgi:hypothetical protein
MRPVTAAAVVLVASVVSFGVAEAQALKMACNVDTLCPGVEAGGGRIMNCLRAHKSELSEKCLAAIGRFIMNRRPKGQEGGPPNGGEPDGGEPQ